MVGEDPLNLSLVQSGQSLGQSVQSAVLGSEHGQPHGSLQGLQEFCSGDDGCQAGQELSGGFPPRGGQAEDLVDHVDLEVGGGGVGARTDVTRGLLDKGRAGGHVLGEDDGDGEVAVEHHVVVQRSDDRVSGRGGDVGGGDGGVEDVQGEDVGEEGGVARDFGGDGREGVVARGCER